MTLNTYECPECGRRLVVKGDDQVDVDSHGRPLCAADGMPMLPATLLPANREETGRVYARPA